MDSKLYECLCQNSCPICTDNFADGSVITFVGPCWVHPLCALCFQKVLQAVPLGNDDAKCPICLVDFDIFQKVDLQVHKWHTRPDVPYPPGDGLNLIKKAAPCCKTGTEIGDNIVVMHHEDLKDYHYMHSWCFLAKWFNVDGNCMQVAGPVKCPMCEDGRVLNANDDCLMNYVINESQNGFDWFGDEKNPESSSGSGDPDA